MKISNLLNSLNPLRLIGMSSKQRERRRLKNLRTREFELQVYVVGESDWRKAERYAVLVTWKDGFGATKCVREYRSDHGISWAKYPSGESLSSFRNELHAELTALVQRFQWAQEDKQRVRVPEIE